MKATITLAAIVFINIPTLASAAKWSIDGSHSAAHFSVRHMMVTNVRGVFDKIKGTVSYDPKAVSKSTVEVTIDASTVDTRDEKRDAHLRNPDFFDVANHPTMTFKSKKVKAKGKGLQVIGTLTLRGVSREVTLEVPEISKEIKDPWGKTRIGAQAFTTINRQDFGIKWNKALDSGGLIVGDDVKITLEIELIKSSGKNS